MVVLVEVRQNGKFQDSESQRKSIFTVPVLADAESQVKPVQLATICFAHMLNSVTDTACLLAKHFPKVKAIAIKLISFFVMSDI